MTYRFIAASALLMALAAPAVAEPTFGLGASYSFGAGGGQTGLGLRLFTDNDRRKMVGSFGIDYILGTGQARPTVGVAVLGTNNYFGADLGIGLNGEGFNFGLGLGGANTK